MRAVLLAALLVAVFAFGVSPKVGAEGIRGSSIARGTITSGGGTYTVQSGSHLNLHCVNGPGILVDGVGLFAINSAPSYHMVDDRRILWDGTNMSPVKGLNAGGPPAAAGTSDIVVAAVPQLAVIRGGSVLSGFSATQTYWWGELESDAPAAASSTIDLSSDAIAEGIAAGLDASSAGSDTGSSAYPMTFAQLLVDPDWAGVWDHTMLSGSKFFVLFLISWLVRRVV